jgi:hypothetical protein
LAAGAPSGVRPVGFMTRTGADEIIYSSGGRVWELASADNGVTWAKYNVSASVGAPLIVGAPRPYVRSDAVNAVVYRDSATNHLRELSFANGATKWTERDMFFFAGIGNRKAASDGVPYIRADGVNAVVYLDQATGHIWELERTISADAQHTDWTAKDLTALTGAPLPLPFSDTPPASGSIRSDGTTAVVFRGPGGQVYQVRYIDGAWQAYDPAQDALLQP